MEQVKQLVTQFKSLLESARSNTEIHPDPFIQEESERTLSELQTVLTSLENSTAKITAANLKPLKDFLALRFKNICDYDAISMHNPHTPANRVCDEIDYELSCMLGIKLYSTSIPSLKVLRNDPMLEHVKRLKPNEFVLSDDNQYAIEIYPCLNDFIHSKKLRHTVIVNGEKKLLSESETNRVINHSEKAKALYDKIVDDHVWELDINQAKKQRRKIQKHNREETFDDENHPDYKVTATYGNAARAKFVKKLFSTPEEIATFLQKHSTNKWDELLNAFDLQDLRTILLNGVDFKQAIANRDLYNQDEAHNRAVLFLYSHLLRSEYQACKDEYMGSSWGWKKEIKEKESDIPHNYLLSGASLAGFAEVLNKTEHSRAAITGKLGALTNQISVVAAYSNPEEVKSWSFMPSWRT